MGCRCYGSYYWSWKCGTKGKTVRILYKMSFHTDLIAIQATAKAVQAAKRRKCPRSSRAAGKACRRRSTLGCWRRRNPQGQFVILLRCHGQCRTQLTFLLHSQYLVEAFYGYGGAPRRPQQPSPDALKNEAVEAWKSLIDIEKSL